MFLADADMNGLRQGDVLADLPFPLIRSEELAFLGHFYDEAGNRIFSPIQTEHRDDREYLTCQLRVRIGFGAVLTQCCNLDLQATGRPKAQAVAVARLIPIPAHFSNSPEKMRSLRANKYPFNPDPAEQGYLNLFHIVAHERLRNQEWVIDFNQLSSLPSSEYAALLSRKMLQMNDDARIRLKVKIAAALTRMTDEEHDSRHPWILSEHEPNPDNAV